ncbi:MAG TPA: NUDIX domain-containing protein [Planctomycetaceae bacterium]|nr:NUDIX domain-containing protein [Planctomycetaceae bacterium]
MPSPRKTIGIAVVEHAGAYLVGTRGEEGPLPGYAEFPGGKCLPGEEPAICASRECLEETGLCVVPVRELMQVEHEYPHGLLSLHFWLCRPEADDAVRFEHRGFAWVPADGLANQRFPEANREVVEMLISGQA